MLDVPKLIRENLTMKQTIQKLNAENQRLVSELKVITKKYNDILSLPKNKLNLDQFVNNYLTTEFTETTMPKSGGIYAYFNPNTEQLYIGQSVNMKNRLKQHFRNGKIKINGHDSEFSDISGWKFYVLEYIDRNNKTKLNDREAYWIAIGKDAVSNKELLNVDEAKKLKQLIKNNNSIKDLSLVSLLEQPGELTNRTRGNNINM